MRFISTLLLCGFWLLAVAPMAYADKRIALLIGNQDYPPFVGEPLSNPRNDINLLDKALTGLNFKVKLVSDAKLDQMLQEVNAYARRVRASGKDAIAFFYYAGHGASDDEGNAYLIPVDVTSTEEEQLWNRSLRLTKIVETLKADAGNAAHFVVFDACRNELKPRMTGSRQLVQSRGFIPVPQQIGMLIAYATARGKLASDSGTYARVLAEQIVIPGVEAATLFRNVSLQVHTKIGQIPWYGLEALPAIHLAGLTSSQPNATLPPLPTRETVAAEAWVKIKGTTEIAEVEIFIRQYGDTEAGKHAKARVSELALERADKKKRSKSQSKLKLKSAEVDNQNQVPMELPQNDGVPGIDAEVEVKRKADIASHLKSGAASFERRGYGQAIRDFTAAISLDPHNAEAYRKRGQVYLACENECYVAKGLIRNSDDLALADGKKSIALEPNSLAYFVRGSAYYRKDKRALAIADLTKAIELDPPEKRAYALRGDLYARTKRYDAAIADANRALDFDPTDATAFEVKGRAYHRKNLNELAIADLSEAIRLRKSVDPSKVNEFERLNRSAYRLRAYAYLATNRNDLALSDAERLNQYDPQKYRIKGIAYFRMNDYDKALGNLDHAIKWASSSHEVYSCRGAIHLARNRYDDAIADLTKAVRLDRNDAFAHEQLGLAYEAKRDWGKALRSFERAHRMDRGRSVSAQAVKRLKGKR